MIKFGTSGFRGIMGDTFTKENVQKVAFAINNVIKTEKIRKNKIIIGYDNRFMSLDYAKWIAEVLAVNLKVEIYEFPVPTPLICHRAKNVGLGVVLTASHNPYNYNGIKIFTSAGKEIDDNFAQKIEKFANLENMSFRTVNFDEAVLKGKITMCTDIETYCNSILNLVDANKISRSKIKVLANAMHGNSVMCVEYLFKKLKLKNYEIINKNIDPYFEHKLPAPYFYNLTEQSKQVVAGGFDLGVAFDGDSDRFTLIGKSGKIYDCNFVVAVLYYYYVTKRGYNGSVVKNKALSNLVGTVAVKSGSNCYDANNGFKNIAPLLENTNAFIGAESNGIAFKEHILSKDGIFACVAIIDALASFKKPFEEVLEEITTRFEFESYTREYAYNLKGKQRENIIKLFEKKKTPSFNKLELVGTDFSEGYKFNYENGYWGMVRFSGCEPVVRIFAEMPTEKLCNEMILNYEDFLSVKDRQ